MHFVRLIVHGRVHGVGFRAFVEHEALRRAIEGWVRNRRDGTVEAVLAGEKLLPDEMVEVCGRGPGAARVERVDVEQASEGDLSQRETGERFSVLHTA